MKRWLAILLLVFVLRAQAHEVRPAYLELTERAPGEFAVLWKVPALGGPLLAGEEIPHEVPAVIPDDPNRPKTMPCGCPVPTAAQLARGVLPIHASLPRGTTVMSIPRVERLPGAEIRHWEISTKGLEGGEIAVHGLQATMVDVLVRIAFADGRVVSRLLRPDAPSFVVTRESAGPAAGAYFVLGVEHIVLGIDHLLFVLALVLIVVAATPSSQHVSAAPRHVVLHPRRGRRGNTCDGGVAATWLLLVKTVTAFTVAHSVTLALATLGVVNVPSAPVEAVIALSIVFVAAEIVRSGTGVPPVGLAGFQPAVQSGCGQDAGAPHRRDACATLTERAPWLVALTFGLLHGFGFAGALADVGLPPNDIPLALLLFNLGVEAGQLAFVAVALAVIAVFRHKAVAFPRWTRLVPPYAIGSVAMFWVIQRVGNL